jgi:hypothetical protein
MGGSSNIWGAQAIYGGAQAIYGGAQAIYGGVKQYMGGSSRCMVIYGGSTPIPTPVHVLYAEEIVYGIRTVPNNTCT